MVLFLHTPFCESRGTVLTDSSQRNESDRTVPRDSFLMSCISFYPVMRRMSFVPSVLSQLSYFL